MYDVSSMNKNVIGKRQCNRLIPGSSVVRTIIQENLQDGDSQQRLFPEMSPVKRRLIETAIAVQDAPNAFDRSYLARELVQCTLPYRDPGPVPSWSRRNGTLRLGITPGWDFVRNESIGFPYGTRPRLLLYWMTTEAVQKQDRCLHLGASYSAFIRKLGLNDRSGGGPRGDHQTLRNQVRRLFAARISFQQSMTEEKRAGERWVNMEITNGGELWWDPRDPEDVEKWQGFITLGDAFFQAITANPVPVDFRHLKALKNSPLTLDLYAWATHKAFVAQSSRKPQFRPWGALVDQFGADYSRTRDFRAQAIASLKKIQRIYEGLKLDVSEQGITVLASSRPAIPSLQVELRQPSGR
jgi:Plasmid encoded RepA protein